MKYFSLILSFIIIVYIKSSTDNVITLRDGRGKSVTFEEDTYYFKTSLDSSGIFAFTLTTQKIYNLKNDSFSYRIAGSESEDVDKGEFKTDFTYQASEKDENITHAIGFAVESSDKTSIVKITGLQQGQTAIIEANLVSTTSIGLIIVVVIIILLVIITLVFCCIKRAFKCICC